MLMVKEMNRNFNHVNALVVTWASNDRSVILAGHFYPSIVRWHCTERMASAYARSRAAFSSPVAKDTM